MRISECAVRSSRLKKCILPCGEHLSVPSSVGTGAAGKTPGQRVMLVGVGDFSENEVFAIEKKMKKIGRFHVLTDTCLQTQFSHLELAELAIAGGADTIQFREKCGETREMIRVAEQLQALCKRAGLTFIVNDRVDVAIASHADGVHLGQNDFPILLARDLLGKGAIIGGSAGNMEEARKCLSEGADYIGFGPVYFTASKEDAGPAGGLDLLKQVVEEIPLPIIAIGGITRENAPLVMQAGVHGIAVISAVCCQKDPTEATQCLRRLLEDH
jgi:thiamine-phosphate pyrophosphorylase